MKFKKDTLEVKDREGMPLSVSKYLNKRGQTLKGCSYAFLIDANLVGLSRGQARRLAKAILKATEKR